jgi:seryl-tRNA synthetase
MKGGEKARAILKKNSFKQRKSKALAETADELAELLEKLYTLPNLPADIVPVGKTPGKPECF